MTNRSAALLAMALLCSLGCGSRQQEAAAPPETGTASGTAEVAIAEPWARSSPEMAAMGAAYLSLRSETADRLIAVDVPDSVAASAELHEVVADSAGTMKMQRVAAIDLPAGAEVRLEPGGQHLMFIDLARPLVEGDTVAVTLSFEKSGSRVVAVPVRSYPLTASR